MSKTLNKKHVITLALTSIASLVMITEANAALTGPYLGGQLGWGNVHQSGSKNTGVAGRVFGGYQLNQNFAIETGYSKFSNATDSFYTVKGTAKTDALDLVGKAILPLQAGFNVYGKLGVAGLREQDRVTVSGATVFKQTTTKVYPTFGAGAGYDLTRNLNADLSWNRIQSVGSSSTKLPSTDLVAVGLAYNFG